MLLDPFNESQISRVKGKDEFQKKVHDWLSLKPVDNELTFDETIDAVSQTVNLLILSAEAATAQKDAEMAFERLKTADDWLNQSLGNATDLRAKTLTASRLQLWEAIARFSENPASAKDQRNELLKLVQASPILTEMRGLIRRDYATETVARFQALMSAKDPAKTIVTTLAGDIDPEPYVDSLVKLLQSKEHPLNGPESIKLSSSWIERLAEPNLTVEQWDDLVEEREANSTAEFKSLKANPDQELKIADQPNSVGRLIAYEFTQDAFTALKWAVYQHVQRDSYAVRINHAINGNYDLAKDLRAPITNEPYEVDMTTKLLKMKFPSKSQPLEYTKMLLETGAAEFAKPSAN